MRVLYDASCYLFLWSTGSRNYCEAAATRLGIADLFQACLPKPDAFVDDMPSTIRACAHADPCGVESLGRGAARFARDPALQGSA